MEVLENGRRRVDDAEKRFKGQKEETESRWIMRW